MPAAAVTMASVHPKLRRVPRRAQALRTPHYRDDDGQLRTHPHNKKGGIIWEPDAWYVPDPEPEPGPGQARPFRVPNSSSEWVDVQSFDDRASSEAFTNGISDTKTPIKEGA